MGKHINRRPPSRMKIEEIPPHIHGVKSSMLPEIRTWDVGGKYRLLIDVEQKSLRGTEFGKPVKEVEADFRIISIKDATGKTLKQ